MSRLSLLSSLWTCGLASCYPIEIPKTDDPSSPVPTEDTEDPDACEEERPWYIDADADHFGDDSATVTACEAPRGYAEQTGDCNDADSAVYPGATEHWYDGTDGNCDGLSDYDQDADGLDSLLYGGVDCNDQDSGAGEVDTFIQSQDEANQLAACSALSELYVGLNPGIEDLSLPLLVEVTGEVYLNASPELRRFWAPLLEHVGAMRLDTTKQLDTVQLDALSQVDGELSFTELDNLYDLDLHSLVSTGGALTFETTALQEVDLSVLASVGGAVRIEGNYLWCVPEIDWQAIASGEIIIGGNACDKAEEGN